MSSDIKKLYDFDAIPRTPEGDKEGMRLASNYAKATYEVEGEVTRWLHSIAVRMNDPTKPMVAHKQLLEHFEGLAKFITSDEAGEAKWTKDNGRPEDFKLTGGSAVAHAIKRLLNAVKLGGDLVGNGSKFEYGNELDTVSKCTKFTKKRNAEIKANKEKQDALEDLHQLIEEETGHERGTPEHDKEFNERRMQMVQPEGEKKPAKADKDRDIYDELGDQVAQTARELRAIGESPEVVEEMVMGLIGRMIKAITRISERLQQKAS